MIVFLLFFGKLQLSGNWAEASLTPLLALAGTELDDVKKLLKGRSCSVSPTRSSNASISQPPSKKATVETQTISVASVGTQSGTQGRSPEKRIT